MSEPDADTEDLTPAEELEDLLEVVVEALGLEADVRVEGSPEELVGTVEGADVGLLIGRHGQTIEAVQHLAQRIVLRGGSGPRVVVDAGGYRAEREATLQAQANDAADSALGSGEPVALPPMSAAERRFVHEHLRERGDVETHSEGQEPERRLIVTAPEG
ncbi:MAG: protein jag [Solirubrobacteraceae bacterium]